MKDLRKQLDSVWRSAARLSTVSGGRCIMFISARPGEGTSSIAASFALMAAKKSERAAWLIDLDLRKNAAFNAFRDGFVRDAGQPGRAYDASLRTEPIYSVSPAGQKRGGTGGAPRLLGVHEIAETRLLVTRFRNEMLEDGQRVRLRTQPDWWKAVRKSADWVVVDAPSLSDSPAGLAMAGQMDGVYIVIEADSTGADDVAGLRAEIEAHGGRVAGAVLNRIGSDARFADRLAG